MEVSYRLSLSLEVPYTVVAVSPEDFKSSREPSSVTTLVGTPTLKALCVVPESKEALPKAEDAELQVATTTCDSDDVSRPTQLIGAFKDVDAACDLPVKREHITSRIRVLSELGSGGYGRVFLVQDTRTRKLYALKVVLKAALSLKDHALIFEEQDILRRVAGNPGFLRLRASFEDKESFNLLTVSRFVHCGVLILMRDVLVQDYYPGGDLFDKIVAQGRISEKEARPMAALLVRTFQSPVDRP